MIRKLNARLTDNTSLKKLTRPPQFNLETIPKWYQWSSLWDWTSTRIFQLQIEAFNDKNLEESNQNKNVYFCCQNFCTFHFVLWWLTRIVFYNPPGSLPTNGFPFPAPGVGGPSPGVAPLPPVPDIASKFLSKSDNQCFVDLSSFKL